MAAAHGVFHQCRAGWHGGGAVSAGVGPAAAGAGLWLVRPHVAVLAGLPEHLPGGHTLAFRRFAGPRARQPGGAGGLRAVRLLVHLPLWRAAPAVGRARAVAAGGPGRGGGLVGAAGRRECLVRRHLARRHGGVPAQRAAIPVACVATGARRGAAAAGAVLAGAGGSGTVHVGPGAGRVARGAQLGGAQRHRHHRAGHAAAGRPAGAADAQRRALPARTGGARGRGACRTGPRRGARACAGAGQRQAAGAHADRARPARWPGWQPGARHGAAGAGGRAVARRARAVAAQDTARRPAPGDRPRIERGRHRARDAGAVGRAAAPPGHAPAR